MTAYAGTTTCGKCHAGIVASARSSSMGRTAMHASTADVLHQHTDLTFQFGQIHYAIESHPLNGSWKSTYTVSDEKARADADLTWIFGTGRVGQSYLYQTPGGGYFESRVTFFQSLKNIGFTPARELKDASADIDHAMGREVQKSELIRCFSCHATAVNIANTFNDQGLIPGVTCEACHGPSAGHVRSMQGSITTAAPAVDQGAFDPSHLSPTESVEFCGACHGSWWDVKLAHVTGPSTVRSAPYRLVTSKCWGKDGDPRLVCTSCHDPHRELVTDISSYDSTCLQCHSTSVRKDASVQANDGHAALQVPPHAGVCPVAKNKCASCHMPQVYVPEMKNTFTDHRIRVVRQGEPFQD